jgi:hypothetical protein
MQSVASMHFMADGVEMRSLRESVLPRSYRRADLLPSSIALEPRHVELSSVGAKIDWNVAPHLLQAGDLSALDRDVARAIQYAAALPEVVVLAQGLTLDPFALVIGLIARSESSRSRPAARLAKAILGDTAREGLDHIAQMLGLKGGSDVTGGN